jgi:uncharacterized membrane protein
MAEKMYLMIIYTSTLLVLLILQILTPRLIRKNILFGVTIPESKLDDDGVELMKQNFKRDNLIIGVPMLIIVSYLLYIFINSKLQVILMFSYIGVVSGKIKS